MSKNVILVLSVIFLAMVFCGTASAAEPLADQQINASYDNSPSNINNVVITGIVTKCSDNSNFSGVNIKADYNGEEVATTKTGSDGSYQLNFYSNMKEFTVNASFTGHQSQSSQVIVKENPNNNISYGTADFKLGIDNVYVSLVGSDTTGDGTQSNPYRTIQKGINEVNTSGTVHIVDDGEFPTTDGILTITRGMTLKGETGTHGTQPKINFPTTSTWCVSITASNVALDNLYLYQGGNPSEGIINVPKGGSWPDYQIVYTDVSITNCVVEWGRRAFYGSVEDLTIENCTFKDQYRDSLFLDGMKGTINIKNNNFVGIVRSANKGIIIESGSGQPYASGDLNIEYNTQIGKAQFFLFNHWGATDQKINLHINHNSIDQTTSKPIVFYCPPLNGFEKFTSILIENNLISNSTPLNTRLAVMVDYIGGAQGVAADGQIVVKNSLCWNMKSNTDPNLNFGWENGDPPGVSMNMYSLSGNLVGDPLYVDPNHADNNFALQSGSPAIGAATDRKNIGAWQSATPEANVVLSKNGTYDPSTDILRFDLTATNNGPDTATGLVISDPIPTNTTYQKHWVYNGTTWILNEPSYKPTTGTWTIGSIPNGELRILRIDITPTVHSTTITNTATRTAQNEYNPQPATVTADVNVPQANVTLTKCGTYDPSTDILRFDLTATNNGPDTATGLVISDPIPTNTTYQKHWVYNGTTWILNEPSYKPTTGTWTIGTLTNGQTKKLKINFIPTTHHTNITNTAKVVWDYMMNPKTASASIYVPEAFLTITKTVDNSHPMVNDVVHFTVNVQNHGPDTAVDVNVQDKMPPGLDFVLYATNYGTYDPETGIWHIGDLPNGAVATITITSTVTGTGSITNEAKVTSLTYDPNIEGTTASVTIIATPAGPVGPSANVAQKTVPMQPTGIPLGMLIVAMAMVLGGLLIPKRR